MKCKEDKRQRHNKDTFSRNNPILMGLRHTFSAVSQHYVFAHFMSVSDVFLCSHENIRKLELFLFFHGVEKRSSGVNWVVIVFISIRCQLYHSAERLWGRVSSVFSSGYKPTQVSNVCQ